MNPLYILFRHRLQPKLYNTNKKCSGEFYILTRSLQISKVLNAQFVLKLILRNEKKTDKL